MRPEIIALVNDFETFVGSDPRLKVIWDGLPKEAGQALTKALEYLPQMKPSYFHQWYCSQEKDRAGLTQRQSYQLFQLGLMFLDKVSRGTYYVPGFLATVGEDNGKAK